MHFFYELVFGKRVYLVEDEAKIREQENASYTPWRTRKQ